MVGRRFKAVSTVGLTPNHCTSRDEVLLEFATGMKARTSFVTQDLSQPDHTRNGPHRLWGLVDTRPDFRMRIQPVDALKDTHIQGL